MKSLVAKFPQQMKDAYQIGVSAKLHVPENPIHHIVISGLGGSGIGGTIVSELIRSKCSVPVIVKKDYFVPGFINKNTLFIASSYSGNTEETLNTLADAESKGCKIVVITSGGEAAEIARNKDFDLILVPGGMPPRACLGYSMCQLIFVLSYFGAASESFKNEWLSSADFLEKNSEKIKTEAKSIASFLLNKFPVIYSNADSEGVAIRFRQQLNENSKVLASHHVIPEMNHNELVGWTEQHPEMAVLFFRSETDYYRIQNRIEYCKTVVQKYTENIKEVFSLGNSELERNMYLIHLGDWVSIYLSELRGCDPDEINVINTLKSMLGDLK